MKAIIKNLLIQAARENKPITYSEIGDKVGLVMESIDDRNELSRLLGDISEDEYQEGRPLISAMAMHTGYQSHGDGFYVLCEYLEIGSKKKLKGELYAFKAMQECHEYWKGQPVVKSRHPIAMFTKDDLEFFYGVYNGNKRISASNKVTKQRIKLLFAKTNYWAKKTVEGFFNYKEDNRWQVSGYYKGYSWAKLFSKGFLNKNVFFTLGIGHNKTLIYKLDCLRSPKVKDHLSAKQVERFEYLLEGTGAGWQSIKADDLVDLNWDDLIRESRNFVQNNLKLYFDAIDYIWNESGDGINDDVCLVKKSAPSVSSKTNNKPPAHRKQNARDDIDYLGRHAENINIGTKGEELVIKYEKEKLIQLGFNALAEEVRKMPDGAGYDILSYDEDKNELYIEVKSTLGNKKQPFYISANELDFFEENIENYKIYRIYNLMPKENKGKFFILDWEAFQAYNCTPTAYKISI